MEFVLEERFFTGYIPGQNGNDYHIESQRIQGGFLVRDLYYGEALFIIIQLHLACILLFGSNRYNYEEVRKAETLHRMLYTVPFCQKQLLGRI